MGYIMLVLITASNHPRLNKQSRSSHNIDIVHVYDFDVLKMVLLWALINNRFYI